MDTLSVLQIPRYATGLRYVIYIADFLDCTSTIDTSTVNMIKLV